MANVGVILELKEDRATIFTEDLKYINIKRKKEMIVGQKIYFENNDILKPSILRNKKSIEKYYVYVASIAAMLVISMFFLFKAFYINPQMYAYIDIDINPSIELVTDKENYVLKIVLLNDDAKKIEGIKEIKGKKLDEAIKTIINLSRTNGFIDMEKNNLIIISYALTKKALESQVKLEKEILEDIRTINIEKQAEGLNIGVININIEEKEEADKNGLSMAKQRAYSIAVDNNMDIGIQEIKEYNTHKILNIVKDEIITDVGNNEMIGNEVKQTDEVPLIPIATKSPSPTPIPIVTPRPTPTVTPISSSTPTATPSPTPTVNPISSPTPTVTPSPTHVGVEIEKTICIKLLDSKGRGLEGGKVKYSINGWVEAGYTDSYGCLFIDLPAKIKDIEIRMEYKNGSQEIKQSITVNREIVFRTIDATVKLVDSKGNGLLGGKVQCSSWTWLDMGYTNVNGELHSELLPYEYLFRMEYEAGRVDIKQDIRENPEVVFKTIDTVVCLIDSKGNGLSGGEVQYSSWTWLDMGYTGADGKVHKELLPFIYTFRMEYEAGRVDIKQDIRENPEVVFKTIDTVVSLIDSKGNGLSGGAVQYLSWTWLDMGYTGADGMVHKELLPYEYTFRMEYEAGRVDIKQDIRENPEVVFKTIDTIVSLYDGSGNPIEGGKVKYSSWTWLDMGYTRADGKVNKELLPYEYLFRLEYNNQKKDIKQNVENNSEITFIMQE